MNSVSTNILNQIRDSDFDERDREDNVKKSNMIKKRIKKGSVYRLDKMFTCWSFMKNMEIVSCPFINSEL